MKSSSNQFTSTSTRLIVAAALVAAVAVVPSVVFAADKDAHEDRAELRVKDMHAKLKITSAQEAEWAKVAEAMRDNARTMDKLTQSRMDHAKTITAVDDLKSYGEIADAHADGIKKLTPVFATLYADMSTAQKNEADILFRKGDHENGEHKHDHKKSESK